MTGSGALTSPGRSRQAIAWRAGGILVLLAAIAIFLCFFMLFLSFTANVRENAWEFGVLRAIGLNVRPGRSAVCEAPKNGL